MAPAEDDLFEAESLARLRRRAEQSAAAGEGTFAIPEAAPVAEFVLNARCRFSDCSDCGILVGVQGGHRCSTAGSTSRPAWVRRGSTAQR